MNVFSAMLLLFVFCVSMHEPLFAAVADEGVNLSLPSIGPAQQQYPLSPDERAAITKRFKTVLVESPAPVDGAANATQVHSRRGDALFFLRRYPESVVEYQAMVRLDPSLDASHWRLGIALFFAGQPANAAAQFDKYHSFDNVDRENGIWRYLSQRKATDAATARKELLRYEKDDREPFPAVYKLFDGSFSAEAALRSIPRNLPAKELEKRLFYTELYIGVYAAAQGKHADAEKYLRLAVSRKWPRDSGFGPNYMWHVARVQLADLVQVKSESKKSP
ncbi:MAG: tetratricopeptide repeat protein [Fuerstiella sp.]|nr:tetratricopeptide repeat protein [Fuerstiella sp.]MCP4507792.1 tetratricopeptide repeat protein [Fuerstiella sp.]